MPAYNSVTSNLSSASPPARWDRTATAWGRRLAAEDAARSEYLSRRCKLSAGVPHRKTHVGDVYGALRVVEHLPKSGMHCMVLCECARGHRVARRTEMLRSTGKRQICRECRSSQKTVVNR